LIQDPEPANFFGANFCLKLTSDLLWQIYLTPKVPWLCFSINTQKLPLCGPRKGYRKTILIVDL
jgi:hypothetical protein